MHESEKKRKFTGRLIKGENMADLHLTNCTISASVSDCDLERVLALSRSWRLKKSNAVWYVVASVRGGRRVKTVRLHRFIMNCPSDKTVDHKNGNAMENERENLEVVSYAVNTKRMLCRIGG